jgi:hypothetical protein
MSRVLTLLASVLTLVSCHVVREEAPEVRTAPAVAPAPVDEGVPASLKAGLPVVGGTADAAGTPVVSTPEDTTWLTISTATAPGLRVVSSNRLQGRLLVVEVPNASRNAEDLGPPPDAGPFAPWATAEVVRAMAERHGTAVIAVDTSTPVRTLARLAASAGGFGDRVGLLAKRRAAGSDRAEDLAVLDFSLPKAEDAWLRIREDGGGFTLEAAGKMQGRVDGSGAALARPLALAVEAAAKDAPEGARMRLELGPDQDAGHLALLLDALDSRIGGPFLDDAAFDAAFRTGHRPLPLELGLGPVPCTSSPEHMTCVPGGPAKEASPASSRTPRLPDRPTFWIDRAEVSVAELRACIAARVCRKAARSASADPSLPATGLRWENARLLCGFLGKRLPSEEELDEAAALVTMPAGASEWTNVARSEAAGGTARCASSDPVLATWPPTVSTAEPAETPTSLDPASRAVVHDIPEDPIEEKPPCEENRGHASLDCKDPIHHIKSNEAHLRITWPWLRNRGGALVGVGSDQNYDMAAVARSEVAWFLDYDAQVVLLHRINGLFFRKADTAEDFVELWSPVSNDRALELIRAAYPDRREQAEMVRLYQVVRNRIHEHYRATSMPTDPPSEGWLRTPGHYRWVRDLWRTGRAWAVKGDMLGDQAMLGIGRASHRLGVPIRIYYTSNAPDAWGGTLTQSYKRNVCSFYMDRYSVVVSTWGFPTGFGGPKGYWHFNLQSGLRQKALLRLPGVRAASELVAARLPSSESDLTLDGVVGM